MNTDTQTAIPATDNESYGFWGTMGGFASVAWPLAMTAVARATGHPLDEARGFLDSRFGRHFANDVQSEQHCGATLADAITRTVATWMERTTKGHHASTYGIPRGLPQLAGFLIHCTIGEHDPL